MKIFKNIHQTPIISIKFYNDNTKSLKYSKALSSENGSKLYRLSFEKGIFSYDCEKQLVLEKNCGQICQIELLNSAILKNNEKTVDHKIFAVASLIRIAIIQIEPKIQQVFILNKPESVKENFPPSISWTEGIFKCESNESSIILMTSWGNHYFLINLNQKKEKIDGILFQGQLIAHLEIKYCAIYSIFLSNRIFISLLENKKGILINLEDFDQISNEISSQVQDSNIDEILIKLNHPIFSYYSEFEYTEKIMFNSFIKDSENMALSCYLQSFTAIRNINKLFFIGEGEIFTIDLFTWKKYINSMINTGDRMSALNTIIKVYKGEEKYVAGIAEIKNERFELMREYSEIMAKDFLLLALKKLDQKNDGYETEVKRLILTVTEFLIETDNSEYLFIEIQQIFDEFALGEKFYENLEFFILNGKIKFFFVFLF